MGDVAVLDRRRRPSRPSACRARRGGSRRAARRGRPRGCAPRRAGADGRSVSGVWLIAPSLRCRWPTAAAAGAARAARPAPPARPGRRGPTTGTTPRTPTAAGRRRRASRALKKAAYAVTSVRVADSKSRTGPAAGSLKKTENIVPADGDQVRHPGRGQRLGRGGLDDLAGGADVGVDLVGGQPERGQAGRGGDGVPGQGAGLVDRPLGRELRHHVGAAAEGRGREAAAHHLAEGHQVGRPALERAVEAPLALRRGAEAGHHLVGDEQRAVARSRSRPGTR